MKKTSVSSKGARTPSKAASAGASASRKPVATQAKAASAKPAATKERKSTPNVMTKTKSEQNARAKKVAKPASTAAAAKAPSPKVAPKVATPKGAAKPVGMAAAKPTRPQPAAQAKVMPKPAAKTAAPAKAPKSAATAATKPAIAKSLPARPAAAAKPTARAAPVKAEPQKTEAAKGEKPKAEAQKPMETKPDVAKLAPSKQEPVVVADQAPVGTQPVAPQPAAPRVAPASPAAAVNAMPQAEIRKPMVPPRPMAKAEIFVEGDHVVYPTHGVGKVERIVEEDIAGHRLELIHITFEENRMTLRVPVAKARTAGLRKLATRKLFDEAMAVLRGRARIKRTMWSRRAQEYEAKINSGDPLAIAEVVRDLHRNAGQPDQSFSERQIYEAAMDRLAAELAALDKTDKPTAAVKLADFLKTIT